VFSLVVMNLFTQINKCGIERHTLYLTMYYTRVCYTKLYTYVCYRSRRQKDKEVKRLKGEDSTECSYLGYGVSREKLNTSYDNLSNRYSFRELLTRH